MHCHPLPVKFTDCYLDNAPEARKLRPLAAKQTGPLASDAYYQVLFSLAQSIRLADRNQPLIISIAGGQGSGKSTLARELALLLERGMGISTGVISLDDFYLPRVQRQQLAVTEHPLLATRGVPGTHDVDWLQEVIDSIRQSRSVACPIFNKADDDRLSGTRQLEDVDVLLCEGWCWGARPEPVLRLAEPVNELERQSDPDGRWRAFVNHALAEYQPAFASDGAIFLSVPSLDAVKRWRWQQEQELAQSARGGDQLMTREQIDRFVSFYERLTRWMLEDIPHRADVVIPLSEDHRPGIATYR